MTFVQRRSRAYARQPEFQVVRVLLVLLCGGCSSGSCSDPAPGSPFATDGMEKKLAGCVGITQSDEKSKGVIHQCVGSGSPKLFYRIECDGPFGCGSFPKRKQKTLDKFSFGEEAYDVASIGACCEANPPADSVNGSCEKVCGNLMCEKMVNYIRFIKDNAEEAKKTCCKPKDGGGFNCEESGQDLLGPCTTLLGKWISAMQDPSPVHDYGDRSWLDYCNSRAVLPADIPMKVDTGDENGNGQTDDMVYDYDFPCQGLPLPDVDTGVVVDTISLRRACLFHRCEISDSHEGASECGVSQFGAAPKGWPDGAWDSTASAAMSVGVASGALTGTLGHDLSGHGFDTNLDRNLTDGHIQYALECNGATCDFALTELTGRIDQFDMTGGEYCLVVCGDKKLTLKDSSLRLNQRAHGTVGAPDPSGARTFTIPTGGLQALLQTDGARGWVRFPDPFPNHTEFDEGARVVLASNVAPITGVISSAGVITIQSFPISSGDFAMNLQFTSVQPNRAPVPQANVSANACGLPTVFDASSSYDPDNNAIAYTWTWEDSVLSHAAAFSHGFPDGDWTVILEVRDGGQLNRRRPFSFVATHDRVPPVLTLNGASPVTLECGVDSYVEAGATAIDNCDPSASVNISGTVNASLVGSYTRTYVAADAAGNTSQVTRQVSVADTRAPVITPVATSLTTCFPAPTTVQIPLPTVQDSCDHASVLHGALVRVNGKPVTPAVPVDLATHTLLLPVGSSEIEWQATDAQGHLTKVSQFVNVVLSDDATVCCAPGQSVTVGNGLPNFYSYPLSTPRCVFGKGGPDTIITGLAVDLLSGGDGNDVLTGGAQADKVVGGNGDDWANFALDADTIYGGPGNDLLEVASSGTVYGNAGDDNIQGSSGNQVIYPGAGRDAVNAGLGNDTVVIYDVCELQPFEVLDGSFGTDTLITPVPVSQLVSAGVIVLGFENIVVASDKRYLSECF
jgi:hypothetical protein